MSDHPISPIEDIIEDARNGRMYILMDAEDRENEGDLIIPAQFATPEAINFMAKYGRGLICLSMTGERGSELDLDMMARENKEALRTAFTVSIEAKEGVTTGISAHDRSHTIAVACDPTKGASDIVSPGHVFPLIAREGGVLTRAGHTEASVDISRMAGLYPAAVICEIMNEDGTMARLDDLIAFAQFHNLKIGTIENLISYRRRNDHFIERRIESDFDSKYGKGFRLIVFRNQLDGVEHFALVKGKIDRDQPILTRVHKMDALSDMLGEDSYRSKRVEEALKAIAANPDGGVFIGLRDVEPASLSKRLGAFVADWDKTQEQIIVEYGVGAQILKDLGARKLEVLSDHPIKLPALEGYGLELTGWRSLTGEET